MADLTLHKDNSNAATIIPNRFIDDYMINANGEFVKIYLYLLRCMNSPDCSFSISKAADKFNHTEKDIQRALKYWEKMNLLQLEYTEDKSIAGIYFLDSEAAAPKDDTVPLKKAPAAANMSAPVQKEPAFGETATSRPGLQPDANALSTTKKPVYSADDLKSFREKEDVQELMFVAESYLARPLTATDIQTLLSWYDWLALSNDLIVYLMEYCIAGGHPSLHYMDRVAINWKNENIQTVEQAKRSAQEHSKLHYAVLKALGIQGRSLTPAEFAYIDKWCKEYGFGQDIITEACSRTILTIHQPNFDYIDRILTNWKRKNIKTMADIRKADEAFQATKTTERARVSALKGNPVKPAAPNRFNNFPQRTYNMDELEAELLAR